MTRPSSTIPEARAATSRQHRRWLSQLADAAATISAASSPREMLRGIAEEARRLIGAEQALVRVSFREDQPMRVFAGAGGGGFKLERDGACLTALAAASRQPLRLNRKGLKSKGVGADLRGWMSAPLLARDGRPAGAIQLANKRHGQFTAEDESLLLQFARFAGIVTGNAQLAERAGGSGREVLCHVGIEREIGERKRVEDEIRARVRQQAAVVELGRHALAGMDLGELMQRAAEVVARTLENPFCKVLELQPDGKTLLLRAGVGWKPGYVGCKILSGGLDSHAGFTLVSSGPVVIDDLRTETRFAEPLLREHRVISGMSVLIEGRERPFGVVGTHTTELRTFTADDVTFLRAVANVLAAAIERKRVEDEIRARLRQQAAVVELGERALKGMEPAELMDHAVALVAKTLDVEFCKVLELLPDGQEMLLRAGVGWKPGYVGRRKIDAGLGSHAGFTLVSSEPVIIEDLGTETRFAEPLLQEHGVVSGISVILEGGGLPFGVLGAHTTAHRRFTHDDVNFLQAVANVLAITLQRSRADQALRQSEQRFRQAQRAANLGAYDWNVTTGAMKWSEELPALKGVPAATFAAWMEGVLAEDRPRVLKALEEAVTQGSDFELEFRMTAPHGVIWVATRGQVFSVGGKPAHVLGVVLDITSRVRAEELLRRSEKLAVVGRLAATIAHEINNPLESVTNLLYLLEHHPTLDESARRYASLAQQELHRVAHIARQTLSFHRESTTAVPVKLSELLDNVLQMHARRIAAADISVERRYDFDPLVKVFPGEMQQVFSNLVLNALEAMGSKGRLLVRVSAGVEWGPARRQGVRVVVADTGNGIPRTLRQQIFEPFFTTKGERGTGLGLWVTNGIVQKHGGSIYLRSSTKPGRSFTCFSIFLPAERATARFARRQREAAAVHPGQLAA